MKINEHVIHEMEQDYPIFLSHKNLNCIDLKVNSSDKSYSNYDSDFYFLLSKIGNVSKPRVSMCYTLDKAIERLSLILPYPESLINQTFYVHVPYVPTANFVYPSTIDVPYAEEVQEVWFTNDIKVYCIGKITIKELLSEDPKWERKIGNATLKTYSYRYEWNQFYKSYVFQESSKNKPSASNCLYYASFRQGLKEIKPDKDGLVTAYKSKKMACIQVNRSDIDDLSISCYGDDVPVNKQLCYIAIKNPKINLDNKFSLYEIENTGFKSKDGRHLLSEVVSDKPVKVLKEIKYDSWVKTITEQKKKIHFEYYGGIDAKTAVDAGGFYGREGIWNSIILDEESGKLLRERVECLIINKNKIFLRMMQNNKYRLPGGSTEHYVSLEDQVINEVNEEAKIDLKNVYNSGINYKDYKPLSNWSDDLPLKWEGKLTHVFVAEYKGKHKGLIHKVDEDNDMTKNGRFYKISAVYDILLPEHKKALDRYFRSKRKSKIAKKINRLKECISSYNIETSYKIIKEIESMKPEWTDEVIVSDLADKVDTMSQDVNYFERDLPEALPCFTPDQMENLGVFCDNAEDNFYKVRTDKSSQDWFNEYKYTGNPGKGWYSKCHSCYEEYLKDPSDINKQRLLELGWNPEVAFTNTSVIRCSQITKESLVEKFGCNFINLTEAEDLVDTNIEELNRIADKVEKLIYEFIDDPANEWIKNSVGFVFYAKSKRIFDEPDTCVFCDYDNRMDKDVLVNKDAVLTVVQKVNKLLQEDGEFQYEIQRINKDNIPDNTSGHLKIWQKMIANDTSYQAELS